MSEPLDRLFREKLADHQLSPSETAWSNVEASLDKEKKGIVWFRAAAAIVLLSALTVTILLVRSDENEKTSAIATVDSPRVTPKPKVTTAPKKKLKSDEPKLPVVKSPSRKMKVYIAKQDVKAPGEVKKEIEQPVHQENVVAVVEEITQPVIQKDQPILKPGKSSITITYTLAPINAKEKNVAATEKKGMQKMVDAVVGAKNSEAGVVTELRIMKDDLFALNFKKNNKK